MVDFEEVNVCWVYFLLYETFFEAVQSDKKISRDCEGVE